MTRITGKQLLLIKTLTISLITLMGCQDIGNMLGPITPGKRIMLWNGKDFSGWERYVDDKNVNINDVWSIKDGVIHCQGVPKGFMRTTKDYRNYHLHVEWRWAGTPTNSGVLVHASREKKLWPTCIENQLKAGNAGDFVLIGRTGITVNAKNWQDPKAKFVIVPKKEKSSEKPAGQWNSYDIYCEKDTICNFVNGVLQNYGTNASVQAGAICLQSEGSPIEFRNIYLEPLD